MVEQYKFIKGLEEWSRSGKTPARASRDVAYALQLQKERLDAHGTQLQYHFEAENEIKDNASAENEYRKKSPESKYYSETNLVEITSECTYQKEDKGLDSKKERLLAYVTETFLKEGVNYADEPISCPNCGANVKIRELESGCPHCNTVYLFQNLFPMVTDYLFVKNYSYAGHTEILKKRYKTFALGGALIGMIIGFFVNLFSQVPGYLIFWGLISSGFSGAMFGCMIVSIFIAVSFFGSVFGDVGKTVGAMATQPKSKKLLQQRLTPVMQGFSFGYFMSEVISLVKLLIFTDDRKNLTLYEGKDALTELDDIIDTSHNGYFNVEGITVNGDVCEVTLGIEMENVYDTGKDIKKKTDWYHLSMYHKIKGEDDGFSMTAVKCKNCGGSFNALYTRKCPYCRTDYDLAVNRWMIRGFTKNG